MATGSLLALGGLLEYRRKLREEKEESDETNNEEGGSELIVEKGDETFEEEEKEEEQEEPVEEEPEEDEPEEEEKEDFNEEKETESMNTFVYNALRENGWGEANKDYGSLEEKLKGMEEKINKILDANADLEVSPAVKDFLRDLKLAIVLRWLQDEGKKEEYAAHGFFNSASIGRDLNRLIQSLNRMYTVPQLEELARLYDSQLNQDRKQQALSALGTWLERRSENENQFWAARTRIETRLYRFFNKPGEKESEFEEEAAKVIDDIVRRFRVDADDDERILGEPGTLEKLREALMQYANVMFQKEKKAMKLEELESAYKSKLKALDQQQKDIVHQHLSETSTDE